jgi:hypothetical protein
MNNTCRPRPSSSLQIADLFVNKEELMPQRLDLRPYIESPGPDVRLTVRDRYAEFDRRGKDLARATTHANRHARRPARGDSCRAGIRR